MKVLVLGGRGATGQLLVQLARGHTLVTPPRAECDATKQADLERALAGCDAVVALLSPKTKSDPVRSAGAVALVAAMKATGVKRLVWVSSSGVGDSLVGAKKTSWFFASVIIPLALKRQLADAGRAEETLQQSGLEVTVVRPMQLVDGERAGEAQAVEPDARALSAKVSRAQLARFIVRELEQPRYIGRMPVLCG